MYFLAIVIPPLAVLLVGRPVQAILNLILWALGIVPGIIHAILVVKERKDNKRMRKQVKMMQKYNINQ